MTVAYINGGMLTWARTRAGLEFSQLAKGKLTSEKLKAWESGDEFPSQTQASALAEKLGISYAMLFMPSVPEADKAHIPDLRTLNGEPLKGLSLNFRQVLSDATIRQEWVRQERQDQSRSRLTFVGQFDVTANPKIVAAEMRRILGLTHDDRAHCNDYEAFLKHLVLRAEEAGILIMRSAVVRHATNKPLLVSEFRGFVLNDPYAPVVFINDSDAKAAQIFTLAHELAHIWIGADGVSDRQPNLKDSQNSIELFCDQVAAELLTPEAEFLREWKAGLSSLENSKRAATHFRVSTLVILRRAKDLGLIPFDTFIKQVQAEYARFKEIERKKKDTQDKRTKKSGGNFWASFELRNGKSFNTAVIASLNSRRVTFTEAATLMGINVASTVRYLRRTGPHQ